MVGTAASEHEATGMAGTAASEYAARGIVETSALSMMKAVREMTLLLDLGKDFLHSVYPCVHQQQAQTKNLLLASP